MTFDSSTNEDENIPKRSNHTGLSSAIGQEAPEYKAIMETTEICEDGELFPLKDITPTLLSDSDGLQLPDYQHDLATEMKYDDIFPPGSINNSMIMLISSIMAEGNQVGNFPTNVSDIHALATANLITQTQEAIIQEYNIDMTSPEYYTDNYTATEPAIPTETDTELQLPTNHDSDTSFTLLENVINDTDQDGIIHSEILEETNNCEEDATILDIDPDHVDRAVSSNIPNVVDNITMNERSTGTGGVSFDTIKSVRHQRQKKAKVIQMKNSDKPPDASDGQGEQTVCEQCGKTFKNRKGLLNHQTCHHPLTCPFPGCGRTFNYPSHYKYHILTHNQDRSFSCECGKVFYTHQQLQVHERTHNLDRPFNCDQCDKSFTTAGNLKNHKRLHSGEKPFICTEKDCDKSFREISALKKHLLTHSGEKPYKCVLCNKRFTQSSSRSYHMKHKHPDQSNLSKTVTSPVIHENGVT